MFCGGCHESRSGTTVIEPGVTDAIVAGPTDLLSDVTRFERKSTDYLASSVGIPWDLALQPIFDDHCVECHDGTPGPANASYDLVDEDGNRQTITFNLTGGEVSFGSGEAMMSGYSNSHLSLLGPMMMDLEDAGITVEGEIPIFVEPENARGSVLIQMLNPPAQYPTVKLNDRAFDGPGHLAEVSREELTPEEFRLLIEMVDNGGQFFSRENAPGENY